MKRPTSIAGLWSLLITILFLSPIVYPSSKLIFPRFSFDNGTYTGLAIANLGTQSARVTLTAYGTDGSVMSGTAFQNPVEIDIPANQQLAKLISEIFQGTLPASSVGWVELTSPADSITGFFLFLNGQLTQLDGADLPVSAGEIVFNLIKVGDGYHTELNFINPSPTEIKVGLSLVQPEQGTTAKEITLSARAVSRIDAASLFGLTTVDTGTYLKAAATSGSVAGFEFVRSDSGDLLGLNAKDVEETLDSIIFPQLVASGPWKSELGLINYTDSPTLVTITAHRSDGSLFGSDVLQSNPVTRGLEAGESVVLDLQEIFGFSGTSAIDGWLQVEATDSAVNGYVSYGIPSVGSLAAIASVKEASKAAVFSHMATASGFFTGVALLNPTTLRANTRIVAMTPEGEILGSYDTVLQPGERVSKLINELIGETANRSNGFVWIHSDLPLYSSSLFGAAKVLANVPAQEAPGEYKPDTNLPTLLVKPPIAVVQPGSTHTFSVQGAPGTVAWSVNGLPGGGSDVGTIDGSGSYTAPSDRPQPSYITVTAESTNLRGGATVDLLKADELLSGLGVLQSIVYLHSLKQLYEVELNSLSALDRGAAPASETQADSQSELFQVAPPSVKTSVRTFSDNIVKMLSYTASDGKEYVLMLGKDSGDLVRLEPETRQTRIVYTGLNSPTSMALDETTGNVLVAEADRITEVAKSFLESGLISASARTGPGQGGVDNSTVLPSEGVTGIEVDLCTGEIYYSVADEGTIYAYNRFTGETTVLASGLSDPGQLLVVYRDDVPCPDSSQLLVAEPGADRISLVAPSLNALISWVSAPGVRDLVYLPPDNPFNLKTSIAYGLYFDLSGSIGIVDVGDQYGDPPPVEEQPACPGEVTFDDPNLEAGVRQALGLQADEPITCELAASMTQLHVPSREISRLDGIRFLENLEVLDISRNLIRNLAPIGALAKLQTLNASYNLVESPGLSANLVELSDLDLSHNLITDLDTLVNLEVGTAGVGFGRSARFQGILPSLIILDLSFNQIFDLGPLSTLLSLQDLDLSANFTITNINALSGLVNLHTLRLFQNSISEIDAVSHLTALVLLDLSSNQVTELHPLLENLGLGEGDVLLLQSNPVSLSSCDVIAELEQRGVTIDIKGICAVDLDLSFTAQPSVARQEDLLLYTARIWNKGTEAAQGVTLDIDYPTATTFRSVRADRGTCQRELSHITCTWDSLGPGSIIFTNLRVEVQSRSGILESKAYTEAVQAELNMDNNEALVTTPIAEADLQVTKTISEDPVTAGSYVTYTVEVQNLGPERATDVTLTDKLPSDFGYETFSTTSGNCSYEEGVGSIVCAIPDIAANSTVTLSIEGTVYATSGTITNSASVNLREFDPDPLNNRAHSTVQVTAPDLVVTKTDSVDPVTTGGDLTYTVIVTNAGNVAATNLVISDNLPAGVNFVSASLPGGTCTPLNLQLECTPSLSRSGSQRRTDDQHAGRRNRGDSDQHGDG